MFRKASWLFFITPFSLFAQQAPDYDNTRYWIVDPTDEKVIELSPEYTPADSISSKVDVFYIHSTTYGMGHRKNASVKKRMIRRRTEISLQNQLPVFAGLGKIYAPSYRQVRLRLLFHKKLEKHQPAFDTAYEDVKNAFDYYLRNWNQNRSIILASHGQGSLHMQRLINEYFNQIKDRLIVAYLPGYPLQIDSMGVTHLDISPCEDSLQTGCFVRWTLEGNWSNGKVPTQSVLYDSAGYFFKRKSVSICHNPITGSYTSDTAVEKLVYSLRPSNSVRIPMKLTSYNITARPDLDIIEVVGHSKYLFNATGDVLHEYDYSLLYSEIRHQLEVKISAFQDLNTHQNK